MNSDHSLLNVIIATDLPVVSHGITSALGTTSWAATHAVCRSPNDVTAAIAPRQSSALIIFLSGKLFLRCNISSWLNTLRRSHPSLPILLAVDHTEAPFFLRNGMLLGIRALLSLDFEPEELLRALAAIRYGQVFTSQELLANDSAYRNAGVHNLTPRERDVLEKFARGLSLTEIAQLSNRSVKTISLQKQSAFRKLGFRGSADLHRFYTPTLAPAARAIRSDDARALEPTLPSRHEPGSGSADNRNLLRIVPERDEQAV